MCSMARITAANAREMAARSALRRRAKPFRFPPIALPAPAQPLPTPAEAAVQAQLDLVAEQIGHTRAVLNDTRTNFCPACERSGIEPHHRAQLLRALDSLLNRQRVLLGLPLPGSMRPRTPPAVNREWEVSPAAVPLGPAPPGYDDRPPDIAPSGPPQPTVVEPAGGPAVPVTAA